MKRQCDFCGYGWITRVAIPKSCPRCKRRFDYSILLGGNENE